MEYLPLFIRVIDQPVVIIGGGVVAARKLRLVLSAGARVRLVAPAIDDQIREQLAEGRISWEEAKFAPPVLDGARLVIAATNQRSVNAAVAAAARERGILVNVVDDAELSDAIMPAIVDRSPLIVAISSGASAPLLATAIRARIESLLDRSLGRLAGLAARFRNPVKAALKDGATRRRFWQRAFDGEVARAVAHGREAHAELLLRAELARATSSAQGGRVLLVGAGPGDPGLLTLRAHRALQEADVVLYDRLVSAQVLALGRRDADYIEVGKRHGEADAIQERILELMREHAEAGKTVVRLKGGDPLLFARGGEELSFLRQHDIPFEIVPGITAALACSAYAGIPLTERGIAGGVRFVTATACASGTEVDWRELANTDDTLAFYMGVAQLQDIAARLIARGRDAGIPAALVENGSRDDQRVLVCTLAAIAAAAKAHAIQAPALLIIGKLAARALDNSWFGAAPIDAFNPSGRIEQARAA